jgi:hypothetical protein
MKELAQALTSARRATDGIIHDAQAPSYSYASTEAMLDKYRLLLLEHGLVLELVSAEIQEAGGYVVAGSKNASREEIGESLKTRCVFALTHISGESREYVRELPVCPGVGRPADKAALANQTETWGYMMRDLLMLPRVNSQKAKQLDISGRVDEADDRPDPVAELVTALRECDASQLDSLRRKASSMDPAGSDPVLAAAVRSASARLAPRQGAGTEHPAVKAAKASAYPTLVKPFEQWHRAQTDAAREAAGTWAKQQIAEMPQGERADARKAWGEWVALTK